MSPQETMTAFLHEVKEKTGCPVDLHEDGSLRLPARLDMARGSVRLHRISLNPAFRAKTHYLAVFHCGLILRRFDVPSGRRVDFARNATGRTQCEKMVSKHLQGNLLPPQAPRQLCTQLFDCLTLQLLSMPVSLRVDAEIAAAHPELAAEQRAVLTRQLQENLGTLSPKVRTVAPEGSLRRVSP
jgi:hypothetical protein